jgi:hypothetical protein
MNDPLSSNNNNNIIIVSMIDDLLDNIKSWASFTEIGHLIDDIINEIVLYQNNYDTNSENLNDKQKDKIASENSKYYTNDMQDRLINITDVNLRLRKNIRILIAKYINKSIDEYKNYFYYKNGLKKE